MIMSFQTKKNTTTYALSIPNVKRVSFSVKFKRSARLSRVEKYNSQELSTGAIDRPHFLRSFFLPESGRAAPRLTRCAFYSLPLFFIHIIFCNFPFFLRIVQHIAR